MIDLIIRNGRLVTETESSTGDIGISDGKIATIGRNLPPAAREIDATGRLVLPGGIDAHCHIEQVSSNGLMGADDFYSGSVAAAFGGNTTIIPFAAQHRGQSLVEVLDDYHRRAREKSVLDYAFHLIVTDPTETVVNEELPKTIRAGITSLKVFLTYDLMALSDEQFLDILDVCWQNGALAMVHAENNGMVKWKRRARRLRVERRLRVRMSPSWARQFCRLEPKASTSIQSMPFCA